MLTSHIKPLLQGVSQRTDVQQKNVYLSFLVDLEDLDVGAFADRVMAFVDHQQVHLGQIKEVVVQGIQKNLVNHHQHLK